MTELQRMAKEFAQTETYADSTFTASNAFEAGFRKARDLAAAIASSQPATTPDTVWPNLPILMMGNPAADKIRTLGDSPVK